MLHLRARVMLDGEDLFFVTYLTVVQATHIVETFVFRLLAPFSQFFWHSENDGKGCETREDSDVRR